MSRRLRHTAVLLAGVVLASAVAAPSGAQSIGKGSGSFRIEPFVELLSVDASIAPLTATPTTADPGPRVFDLDDRVRFNGRWTNTLHVVTLQVSSATDGLGAGTKQVQGEVHTIADWIHVRQGGLGAFGTVRQVGTVDPAAEAYTVPVGFTQDSQGILTLRRYATADPADGGTTTTLHWAYDATADGYWVDASDKDFTNGNGERLVYPLSHGGMDGYGIPLDDLTYHIGSVAGAGAGYVPTVQLGWQAAPGLLGGHDFDATVLFDFPSGAPSDTYSFEILATIHGLK